MKLVGYFMQHRALAARGRVVGADHVNCGAPGVGFRVLRVAFRRCGKILQRAVEVVPVLTQLAAYDQDLGVLSCRRIPRAKRRIRVSHVARIALGHREIEIASRKPDCRRRVRGCGCDLSPQASELGGNRVGGANRQPLEHHRIVARKVRNRTRHGRDRGEKAKGGAIQFSTILKKQQLIMACKENLFFIQ